MEWYRKSPLNVKVAANVLNKQSLTAETGWSSSLWVGSRGAANNSPQKISILRNVIHSFRQARILQNLFILMASRSVRLSLDKSNLSLFFVRIVSLNSLFTECCRRWIDNNWRLAEGWKSFPCDKANFRMVWNKIALVYRRYSSTLL